MLSLFLSLSLSLSLSLTVCDLQVISCASKYGGGVVASAPPYSPTKCLEAALLGMLDVEIDRQLRSDICDTVTSLLSTCAPSKPRHWLMLCYAVLSSAVVSDSGMIEP